MGYGKSILLEELLSYVTDCELRVGRITEDPKPASIVLNT